MPAIDNAPLPDCTSTLRIPLVSVVGLTFSAVDEEDADDEDSDDPFGYKGASLPFLLPSSSYTNLLQALPIALPDPPLTK
jgi:hypothetical protein